MHSFVLCVLFNVLICEVWSVPYKLFGNEQKCGVETSSNLIHHNPWLVYLEYWRGDELTEIRCAATLIDSRHIITAAHCVRSPKYSRLVARLGEYDLYSKVDCVQGVCADPIVTIPIAEIIVHPGYEVNPYDGNVHDIAILKLEKDAPYTDFIRPVCLPSGDIEPNTVFSAAGFGEIPNKGQYSHVKKIIPLPFWTKQECREAYKYNVIPDDVICAGGVEGIDTCRGDSGGPLTQAKDTIELRGVTKGGNVHCGTKGSPGIYTNVAQYMDWIEMVVES